MRYEWLDDYLLQKRGVTKDYQPIWNWIRYHIGGKMFAALCLDKSHEVYYINLKLEESESAFLRSRYADILPGYYSDKRCWVSVKPDGAVPDDLLRGMLDKSYGLTLAGMSKKARRQALGLTACGLECNTCPLYQSDCPGCGGCADAPCALWEQVRDPALSEEEFRASVAARLKNLNEVPEIGR